MALNGVVCDIKPSDTISRMNTTEKAAGILPAGADPTAFGVLGGISLCHFLNDMLQSLILALYPVFKGTFRLDFAHIGLITLVYQVSASLLQPLVGLYTDRHPQPQSLAVGMTCTLLGLLVLAFAPSYAMLLVAAVLVGVGSAIFHPESSRVARLASGGQHGMAQSIFQVGGNAGSAAGPLLAAWIVIPHGQRSVVWFSLAAMLAIAVLWRVGRWHREHGRRAGTRSGIHFRSNALPRKTVAWTLAILMVLVFSKYFYLASLSSYYTFYLMHRFHVTVQEAQVSLFVFLFAVAAGTVLGGPIGDRIGRKYVIWVSILGAAPFTLLLPHVNLFWTRLLTVPIGLILASAFSAILVYAQELIPGKVGMVSGLFFGFAFGMGGIGAAVLGRVADAAGIEQVYRLCAFLPLLGLLSLLLPDVGASSRPIPADADQPTAET